MIIELKNKAIEFENTPLLFKEKGLGSIFISKNNKTLLETLEKPKYKSLKSEFLETNPKDMEIPLGLFLKNLKEKGDKRYLKFLNKYGDNLFCEFSIETNLSDNGIYCWVKNDKIKYVGRCTDNFKKRINQGYGKINAKNCFKDGQATNCHLNSQINKTENIKFFIHKMTYKTKQEIQELEKEILTELDFEWNIQKS